MIATSPRTILIKKRKSRPNYIIYIIKQKFEKYNFGTKNYNINKYNFHFFMSVLLIIKICIFSRVLRDSMTHYVCRSVRRSVGPSPLTFFGVYGRFLRYCSCPPARDFGSRVYGRVFIRTTFFGFALLCLPS